MISSSAASSALASIIQTFPSNWSLSLSAISPNLLLHPETSPSLYKLAWVYQASPSSFPSCNYKFDVFVSFHGPDLHASKNLKYLKLPNSMYLHATNLEDMNLNLCESLVEIPSSFSHLQKLQKLWVGRCINLQVIPAHMNLVSLETVHMNGCSRMRNIPLMSTNIKELFISETAVEGVPPSVRLCSRLEILSMSGSGKLKGLTSLPELPASLIDLYASDCESLKTAFSPLNTPEVLLNFTNCFKLDQQSHREIIQRPHVQTVNLTLDLWFV